MSVPELTREQRLAASKKAVEFRKKRKEIRDAVRAGKLTVAEVLALDDEAIARMPIQHLLVAVPGVGKARTQKLLEQLQIAESRRLGGLGCRQRQALVEWEKHYKR